MPPEPACPSPRGRDPIACPDRTRWARCDLLAAIGGVRLCRIAGSPEAPRVEHWFALAGDDALQQGRLGERERSRLLFDLAVRGGPEREPGAWFVQAAFDPSPAVRQLTCAAIATLGVFVAARRAGAHALLLQVQRRGETSTALTAGLTALTAAIRGDASFPVAVLRAEPEARATMLAEWGGARLAGQPLREPEWRRLAGHVHAGRRGERLLRRLLRARTTRDVRDILQRISERRGGRGAAPVVHAVHAERRADPWDERGDESNYADYDRYRDHDHDYDPSLDDPDGWPTPIRSPALLAALELVRDIGVDRRWPAHLGDHLSQLRRTLLARQHPAEVDAVARMLADPAPLRCLADLELLALARRQDPTLTHACDDEALLVDLRRCMAVSEVPDPRLRCEALRQLTRDPVMRRAVIAALPGLHPEQRCLAQLAALWPGDAVQRDDPAIVEQLLHSDLAAQLMVADPPGGLDPHPAAWRSVDACARDLLRTGAGSLRGIDYPAFTLVCRPSLSVVRPEHMAELGALGGLLTTLRAGVAADDPAALLRALDEVAEHDADTGADAAAALVAHACAYATLRCEVLRGEPGPIREAHVRKFADRRGELASPPPTTLAGLRQRFGEARLIEGLAHAMLAFSREPPAGSQPRPVLRRVWTHRLRLLAANYELPPTPVDVPGEPEDSARALVEHLVRAFEHARLELAQALHIPHRQGLPKLGGVAAPLERRVRRLVRDGLQLADSDDGEATCIELRPLAKRVALHRGALGRDCSSRYVPLRALSPHHVYYGLFAGDTQLPGYVTVLEAFAGRDGGRVPVLALETINIPDGALDGVHQDLLLILDAIAGQRGLAGLAVISGIGTWNYPNERLVTACRRHRQGAAVSLGPADPALWRAHEQLSQEGGSYSAFRSPQPARLLAAFDRARDLVQPENAAEAQRLRSAPATALLITARAADGEPAAFITAMPGHE